MESVLNLCKLVNLACALLVFLVTCCMKPFAQSVRPSTLAWLEYGIVWLSIIMGRVGL